MQDPVLTTHAGSLPRPEDLIALNERRAGDDPPGEAEYLGLLRAAVADVVTRQRTIGISVANDGEHGHSMGQRYDYGSYVFQRLGGIELTPMPIGEIRSARARLGEIALASFGERRDFQAFAEAYADPALPALRSQHRLVPGASIACDLLAWLRLLALEGDSAKAEPRTLRHVATPKDRQKHIRAGIGTR